MITHTTDASPMWRSRWIAGSARTTIVVSTAAIITPTTTTSSARLWARGESGSGRAGSATLAGRLNLEQLGLRVVDLQRRVRDPPAFGEELREVAPGAVAVAVGLDEDVRGERGEARGDLPDVEVVDLDDSRDGGEGLPDRLRVDAARRRLEEHPGGGHEQAVGGAEHQPGDEQRGDRVGSLEAARQDHRRRYRCAD